MIVLNIHHVQLSSLEYHVRLTERRAFPRVGYFPRKFSLLMRVLYITLFVNSLFTLHVLHSNFYFIGVFLSRFETKVVGAPVLDRFFDPQSLQLLSKSDA